MPNAFKSRKELAGEYGIDRKTLAKILKQRQIELPPGLLSPEWVERVYDALGHPDRERKPPPQID